ncbi:hypothetical protein VYU27_008382, partial [Nannochloropsis oceanica]
SASALVILASPGTSPARATARCCTDGIGGFCSPPSFHPNMSSLQWQEHVLTTLGGGGGGGGGGRKKDLPWSLKTARYGRGRQERREGGKEGGREGGRLLSEAFVEETCLESGTNAMTFICDVGPGEVLHFSSMWWYAVLNLEDYNVFVSTFTHEYDEGGREGGRDEQVEHHTNVAMK